MADERREPGAVPTVPSAESPDPQDAPPVTAEAYEHPAAPGDAQSNATTLDTPDDEPITAQFPIIAPIAPAEPHTAQPDPQANAPVPLPDMAEAPPLATGSTVIAATQATPPPLPASLFAPVAAPTDAPAPPQEGVDAPLTETPPVEAVAEEEPATGRRALTFFREFVETILLTLVIFVAVRTLVVNFRVDGESMRPTLQNGEYLLVNRATYFHYDLNALRNILPGPDRRDRDVVYLFGPPERGDIIVFEPPTQSDKPFVKRVIGLPGDTIAIRQDHIVYVNGQPLAEHYIAAPPKNLYPLTGGEYTVPPGMIFVMGDNRNNSQDSRFFNAVSMDSVIGKAVVSYWPLDVFGFIPHERYALAGGDP